MGQAIDYREIAADRDLQSRVSCFWQATAPKNPPLGMPKRVLPDGCADFLFDLQALEEGRAGMHFIGAMTRPLKLVTPPGQRLFGIRFRPGGLGHLIEAPQSELRDQRIELERLGVVAEQLAGQLLACKRPEQMALCAQAWLREHATDAIDELVLHAVRAIEHADNMPRVQSLAERCGVSRQHLAKRFADQIGLSPKELQRILRLQRSLSMMRVERSPSLATIALRSGYCDQAHMNLDYRALAGTSPSKLAN